MALNYGKSGTRALESDDSSNNRNGGVAAGKNNSGMSSMRRRGLVLGDRLGFFEQRPVGEEQPRQIGFQGRDEEIARTRSIDLSDLLISALA